MVPNIVKNYRSIQNQCSVVALYALGMKNKTPTAETFASNLKMLLDVTGMKKDEVGKKAGISGRYISMLINGERTPTVMVADDIAAAFGISVLEMLRPGLVYDTAKAGGLTKVLDAYAAASDSTKQYVDEVLRREAIQPDAPRVVRVSERRKSQIPFGIPDRRLYEKKQ